LSKAEQSINRGLYLLVNPFSCLWAGVSVLQEAKFELSNLSTTSNSQMPKSTKKKKEKPADFTVKDYVTMAQLFGTNGVLESKAQARKGKKASPKCRGYLV
jgi:hypothetical protein